MEKIDLGEILKDKEVQLEGKYSSYYQGAWLPISIINVLPQPRKTFEGIPELALDIAKKKLLNPLIVARLDEDDCKRYIAIINFLWGTSFELNDLHSVEEEGSVIQYILLAGERRLKACYHLWNVGCQDCQENYGSEPEGNCFKRHFGTNKIEVRLCLNIPPLSALFLQFSENIHRRVPPHEEARAYNQLFRLIKEVESGYPITKFARNVGRSPETIKNALRFCKLPSLIQEFVEKGLVPYGIAVEIARIQELGTSEDELRHWALKAATNNYKVPDFRELVTRYIRFKMLGQTTMLDLMERAQREEFNKPQFRKIVAVNMIKGVWFWIYYFRTVLKLLEEGLLGKADSPFSEGSPVRVFRRLVELLKEVLPHFKIFLPKREYPEIKQFLEDSEQVFKKIS